MHAHNASDAEQMKFRCYGVEKEPDTVKLAKMNLLLNNVRGEIIEANSFYSDPYGAVGAFDYVMANPPFNVDEVSFDRVSGDERFNTYGVPRNSTKSAKKASDKKETVPNANYLWIGYFATAMNENGKAALVMANSASDAGKSEYEIRKKMIEEGIISQMVTLPSNMFSSVTLLATLWFFDKHKPQTDKKDEILFIDARNGFTQVDRAHRKFSDEQIKNLGIITRLYHGDTEAFAALTGSYKTKALQLTSELLEIIYKLNEYEFCFTGDESGKYSEPIFSNYALAVPSYDYGRLKELSVESVTAFKEQIKDQLREIEENREDLEGRYTLAPKQDAKLKAYFELADAGKACADEIIYFLDNLLWLLERFPDGVYRDVIGLCKAAKLDGEDGIIDQDYSLNAGRYVGVVIEDDGMTEAEFKETMLGLNAEFGSLNEEAKKLEAEIAANIKILFGEEI